MMLPEGLLSVNKGIFKKRGPRLGSLSLWKNVPFGEQRDSGPANHHVYAEMRARFIIYLN